MKEWIIKYFIIYFLAKEKKESLQINQFKENSTYSLYKTEYTQQYKIIALYYICLRFLNKYMSC